jgi:hypothetical protein
VSADSEYERLAAVLREHRPTRAVALLAALERLYSDEGERLDALACRSSRRTRMPPTPRNVSWAAPREAVPGAGLRISVR